MQLYDTVAVCVGSDVVGIAHVMTSETCKIVPLWPFAQAQSPDHFIPGSGDPMPRLTIDYDFPLVGGGRTLRRFYQTPRGTWEAGIVVHPKEEGSRRYDRRRSAYLRPVQPGDSAQVALYRERIDLDRAEREAPQIKARAETLAWVRKNPILPLTGLPPWKVRMILKIVAR